LGSVALISRANQPAKLNSGTKICFARFVASWIKIKTIRPFPYEEIKEATKRAKHIFVPEFNLAGWLAREIKATVPNNERVIAGPHVAGGMTMPCEVIVEEIKKYLGLEVAHNQ